MAQPRERVGDGWGKLTLDQIILDQLPKIARKGLDDPITINRIAIRFDDLTKKPKIRREPLLKKQLLIRNVNVDNNLISNSLNLAFPKNERIPGFTASGLLFGEIKDSETDIQQVFWLSESTRDSTKLVVDWYQDHGLSLVGWTNYFLAYDVETEKEQIAISAEEILRTGLLQRHHDWRCIYLQFIEDPQSPQFHVYQLFEFWKYHMSQLGLEDGKLVAAKGFSYLPMSQDTYREKIAKAHTKYKEHYETNQSRYLREMTQFVTEKTHNITSEYFGLFVDSISKTWSKAKEISTPIIYLGEGLNSYANLLDVKSSKTKTISIYQLEEGLSPKARPSMDEIINRDFTSLDKTEVKVRSDQIERAQSSLVKVQREFGYFNSIAKELEDKPLFDQDGNLALQLDETPSPGEKIVFPFSIMDQLEGEEGLLQLFKRIGCNALAFQFSDIPNLVVDCYGLNELVELPADELVDDGWVKLPIGVLHRLKNVGIHPKTKINIQFVTNIPSVDTATIGLGQQLTPFNQLLSLGAEITELISDSFPTMLGLYRDWESEERTRFKGAPFTNITLDELSFYDNLCLLLAQFQKEEPFEDLKQGLEESLKDLPSKYTTFYQTFRSRFKTYYEKVEGQFTPLIVAFLTRPSKEGYSKIIQDKEINTKLLSKEYLALYLALFIHKKDSLITKLNNVLDLTVSQPKERDWSTSLKTTFSTQPLLRRLRNIETSIEDESDKVKYLEGSIGDFGKYVDNLVGKLEGGGIDLENKEIIAGQVAEILALL